MNPLVMSAQFAAYTWFEGCTPGKPEDAVRFAKRNWHSFLGCAHEGMGRLLIRLAKDERGRRPSHKAAKQTQLRRQRVVPA